MTGVFGQTATFSQADSPDIELVVFGDEWYAWYETPAGYTVIYDAQHGRFCYAVVRDGCFVSTGVAASAAPPPGTPQHAREAPAVRHAIVQQKRAARSRSGAPPEQ